MDIQYVINQNLFINDHAQCNTVTHVYLLVLKGLTHLVLCSMNNA